MRRFLLAVETDLGHVKHNGVFVTREKPVALNTTSDKPVALQLTHAVNLITVHERESRLRALCKKEGDLLNAWRSLRPRLISLINITCNNNECVMIKGRNAWFRWRIVELNDHALLENQSTEVK